MIRTDRSTRSMGFTLRWITVSMMLLSKACVAAITTCRDACEMPRAPEHVSASSRSKALFFSLSRSLEPR